jgi:predicted small metal-binding protein
MGFDLRCGDIAGECDFEAHGKTEEEVLLEIGEHIKIFHGLMDIPKNIQERFRKFIREEVLT